MGDLKKKNNIDYRIFKDDKQDILVETDDMEAHTLELFKAYMQKFYDIQAEKKENKE